MRCPIKFKHSKCIYQKDHKGACKSQQVAYKELLDKANSFDYNELNKKIGAFAMDVYVVFLVYGDDDGNSVFEQLRVAANVEVAKEFTRTYPTYVIDSEYSLVHSDMTQENNYTYVGNCANCCLQCEGFGGYVIEKQTLLE